MIFCCRFGPVWVAGCENHQVFKQFFLFAHETAFHHNLLDIAKLWKRVKLVEKYAYFLFYVLLFIQFFNFFVTDTCLIYFIQ